MTAIKSLGSGVSESFNSFVDNAPIIGLGSALAGGIGFLVGGAPVAWLAAKITALVMGIVYTMGRPTCVIEPNICSPQNCHTVGRVATSAGLPYFLVYCVQILVS